LDSFFVSERDGQHGVYFNKLLQATLPYLHSEGVSEVYTLSLYPWTANLFEANGFSLQTHIITLSRKLESLSEAPNLPGEMDIRSMTVSDLDEVEALDRSAFPPAWQMNRQSLQVAYQESAFNAVIVSAKGLLSYIITTSTFSMAHLARLAVAPEAQHQHLGHIMVQTFLEVCINRGIDFATVTPSSDNHASP